ncbi:glycerol kinase [Acididesulfobacillus acetoxydans]|uniref:Chaperone protein DnaK n=1 Tax=Acididesulfobacillus acetoxydans TaxID=1561005 RepID=A0A8S0WFC6_9FIRM|nr:FGGY family carbohydrate kinase [Acididesulfobacillus acetoxydans]CAA7600912.1 glycerol kinase [Acididesulfobacillus acetoxydans]CEJ08931.1 Xylulose kinase [Acididesulfobacillus acetoxydans]
MQYVLGIDLGTSSCKTVLFTDKLIVVCSASAEYGTSYPRPGWAEQRAEEWWEALRQTVSRVLTESRIKPSEIAAIGVDSQGSTVLPVTAEGQALRPGLIWMDRRAEVQCRWIDENLGDSLWQISGNHNDPSNIAPKVLWLKNNEPDVYSRADKFMHANGYLIYRLTGQFSMDKSEGGLTQLFDTVRGSWSEELIMSCGIDRAKLPDIYDCFEVVGQVTTEAARETGLCQGTPVVAGAMDMVASALGAGVYHAGEMYVAAGTVTALGVAVDEPKFTHSMHLYHHIIPDLWINAAGVDFGGGGLRWLRNVLSEEDYLILNDLAQESCPGSNGLIFLPYMVGQRAPLWNSATRGVIMGLHPATGKADFIRMFMEGNAFGVRNILDIAEKEGLAGGSIRMTGGCTQSPIWTQIFADITGKNIEVPGALDVAALGSAVTAAVGIGMFRGFEEALTGYSLENTYQVRSSEHQLYEKMFRIYKRIYANLREEFTLLAEIGFS